MRRCSAAFTAVALVVSLVAIIQPSAAGAASAPVGTTGLGYWEVQGNGSVAAAGDAGAFTGKANDKKRIVGIAAEPRGQGYVVAGADGRVFPFGTAKSYGSMAGVHLHKPIVGIAYTPSGHGYYLVASDGGVFTFGDAQFHGSTGAMKLNSPIVGIASTPTGHGYWLVAGDGGIFTFGDASFHGSAGGSHVAAPIAGMAATHDGRGYWLAGSGGALYAFGDARNLGSAEHRLFTPIVGITASATGTGYLIVSRFGQVAAFGDAPSCFPGGFGKFGGFGGTRDTVGIAIPFDPAARGTYLSASCGGSTSQVFHATAPWHIDFTTPINSEYGFYCELSLLRGSGGEESATLASLQSESPGRLEIRSTLAAGSTTFRISSGGPCVAIAREGTGGTQALPFNTTSGGDSLPFTSASPITITGASLQPCQVEVFADSDGHFVDGHFGSHANIVVPAGTYFIRSDPSCNISVS